jgi:hypothetical protein
MTIPLVISISVALISSLLAWTQTTSGAGVEVLERRAVTRSA